MGTEAKAPRRSSRRFGFMRVAAATLLALFGAFGLLASAQDNRIAIVLTPDDAVGPATADHVMRQPDPKLVESEEDGVVSIYEAMGRFTYQNHTAAARVAAIPSRLTA